MRIGDKIMESMMKRMMDKMSKEERQDMVQKMMREFMGKMTSEEKCGMMMKMMHEMMKGMFGEESKMPMMEMMSTCMSSECKPPWVTLEEIMDEVLKHTGFAIVNTPELHILFREFLDKKGDELLSKITDEYKSFEEIQKETGLSRDSLVYLILQLVRREEIEIRIKRRN